jgi:solute carrier family 25 folate transporter 32
MAHSQQPKVPRASPAALADWRPAMAGVLGGSLSTLLLHPLDLLKTRQAVHGNGDSATKRAVYGKVGTAFKHIVKNEGGIVGLYKGVGTNVAVAGTSWGLTFMW